MPKILAAGFLAWLSSVIVSVPVVIPILIGMQILDLASGVFAAQNRKELQSAVSWHGNKKKAMMWVFVLAVAMLQVELLAHELWPMSLANLTPFETVAWFFIVTEFLSILENARDIPGLRLPGFLGRFADAVLERFGETKG